MSANAPPTPASSRVQPTHERAVRAVKALDEGRITDARTNAEAIGDSPTSDLAWKTYLLGCVQFEQGELKQAQETLEKAAALAVRLAEEIPSALGDAMRLSAQALEQLGRVFRRGERIDEALRAHRAAYQLRREHGSALEQWESSESVSLDHVVASGDPSARTWCERAIEHAHDAGVEYEARSRGLLVNILLRLQRFEEAVIEARTTAELWRAHDPGDRRCFVARRQTGVCLLRHAERCFEGDALGAGPILDEAIQLLEGTRDELRAFGEDSLDEARECDDLLDLAGRLRASLV